MDSLDKKQEILKAAGECFARYGYEKTTLDDIGRLVGLNKASLYYYYKNKEELFSAVIYRETEALFQALQDMVGRANGCQEQILMYLSERLKYVNEMVNLRNLPLETIQKFKPIFEELNQKFIEKEIDFLNRILEECQKRKEIIPGDTRRIAGSILTVTEAIRQRYIQRSGNCLLGDPDILALKEEVCYTVSLILNGIIRKDNRL